MFENKKIRTILILIGIVLLVAGAFSTWTIRKSLNSGDLSEDEDAAYQKYYFIAKMVFLVGFIVALVPSVKGALYDLSVVKAAEDQKKSSLPDGGEKTEEPEKKNKNSGS